MLNHQTARARVADHTARAERLAFNRQLLATGPPEKQTPRHRWRNRPRSVSVRYTEQGPIQA
jgi:hypothetical protein